MQLFPEQEQEIFIDGPIGLLQIIVASPKDISSNQIAVICHPHPQQSGTMHNKVVTTIHKSCEQLGMRTVRFNFRGVGKSEGQFAAGIGETEDVHAILTWLQQLYPHAEFLVAGFSFGAYIAYRLAALATHLPIKTLLTVAIPFYAPLAKLPEPTCQWIAVQALADEVVDNVAVKAWLINLTIKPKMIALEGASHFFHKRLIDLRELLIKALSE